MVSGDLGLRDEEDAFKLSARLFEQLPFAVYVCDRDGLVVRYNRRAAELWGLNSAIPMNGFADRFECSAPTAVCSGTINAPWPMC
jgi:PAS domain-containing protein